VGIQFDLQFPGKDHALKRLVLSHVGGDHLLHLAIAQQDADAGAVYPGVVGNDGEILRAFALHGGD